MKGAEPLTTTIYLVLGGILLGVLVFMIFNFYPWGTKTIKAMFDEWFKPRASEDKWLMNTMQCAYYRCKEGCESPKVGKLSWTSFLDAAEGRIEKKVKCKDFCKPEWTDTGKPDGKICGNDAKQHPVNITLENDVNIESDDWFTIYGISPASKIGQPDSGPFIAQGACEPCGWAVLQFEGVLVFPQDAQCETGEKEIKCKGIGKTLSLKSCELPAGSYQIWADRTIRTSAWDIVVCPY